MTRLFVSLQSRRKSYCQNNGAYMPRLSSATFLHKKINITTLNKNMKQYRDSIDFGKENIPRLFLKLFVPTLLGLLFGAMLNLADGIFVGQGVGSDALAAVNVAAPVFMIGTGTALLFGGEGRIVPYACDYLVAVAPVLVLTQILFIGMFVLRLDGAPKFAMAANITASLLNIPSEQKKTTFLEHPSPQSLRLTMVHGGLTHWLNWRVLRTIRVLPGCKLISGENGTLSSP